MARLASPIALSSKERVELERLVRAACTPQQTAQRARMIIMAAAGLGVGHTARILGVWRKGVTRQRSRWAHQSAQPVLTRLGDAPRSGKPATFTAEQTCAIMALDRPAPSWRSTDLRHHGARLRSPGSERPAVQSVERLRSRPRSDKTPVGSQHIAPLGGAFFKTRPISSRIASGCG